jgi:hypothetical protein
MKVLFALPKAKRLVQGGRLRKPIGQLIVIVILLPEAHLLNIIISYLAKMITLSGFHSIHQTTCTTFFVTESCQQHHLCRAMQHFSLQQQGPNLQSSAGFSSGSCQVTAVGTT